MWLGLKIMLNDDCTLMKNLFVLLGKVKCLLLETNYKMMNKIKPLFSLGLSLLFIVLGISIINKSQVPGTEYPTLQLISGISCVVFFGGIFLLGLAKIVRSIRSRSATKIR